MATDIVGGKVFRNLFALVVWLTTTVLFILHGANVIQLPEMIIGSMVTIDTLIVQFYFRKRPSDEKTVNQQ